MTPAATAVFIIKNGDRVGWLAVHNELIERVLAGFDTGRTLNGMNATNKIQCIDNKQMNSHDNPLKDQAIRVTFDARTGYGWMRNREEASQKEASGERLIAGNDLHCQAAARGFAVLGVHIFTCFVHGFDNFIEADARLAGTA